MAEASPARPRPLSPHAGQWRWHVTMVASILNRMTAVACYAGLLIAVAAALALASGEDAYGRFLAVAGSWPVRLALIGVTFSALFHLLAGLRHLAWDGGWGFRPSTANRSAWGAMALAVLATAVLWGWLLTRLGA